jgi:hypothetical protein
MFAANVPDQSVELTLYTDAYVARGRIRTRQRRVSDILNQAEEPFLVIADAVYEEYGSRGDTLRAEYAQVNLGTVLFAVTDLPVEPAPELRTPKTVEQAMITVPPFKITGRIHLLPERDLREALSELVGAFVPVTDVTYWSDSVAEPRTTVGLAAVNHTRAQILAPYRVVDPWAGMPVSRPAGSEGEGGEAPESIPG